MDEKQKTLKLITDAIEKQINNLQFVKKTGTIELTVRLNMSQGFIGAAAIKNVSEEVIFK